MGQNALEEVHRIVKGGNHGWKKMEGTSCFRPPAGCQKRGLILPISQYGRSMGRSITGGFVYRGASYPALQGAYIYADYCDGRIWALVWTGSAWETQQLATVAQFEVVSFGEDEAGELYVAMFSAGEIRRLAAIVVNQPVVYRAHIGASG